jgi:hypothetical protein
MELLVKIIGDLVGAILPPILSWLFSGTVIEQVKTVSGLPLLDSSKPDAPISLPTLGDAQ